VTRWTTVPRWLYENDLPDEELQRMYVTEAEKKLRQIVAHRKALQAELAGVLAAEARAAQFVAEAWESLRHYQAQGQGPSPAGRPRRPQRLPAARLLPKPDG
jgi:hypothetical protein